MPTPSSDILTQMRQRLEGGWHHSGSSAYQGEVRIRLSTEAGAQLWRLSLKPTPVIRQEGSTTDAGNGPVPDDVDAEIRLSEESLRSLADGSMHLQQAWQTGAVSAFGNEQTVLHASALLNSLLAPIHERAHAARAMPRL